MDRRDRSFPGGSGIDSAGAPAPQDHPKLRNSRCCCREPCIYSSLRLSLGGLAYGRDCGGGLSPLILLPIFCTSVPRGLTVCQRMGLA